MLELLLPEENGKFIYLPDLPEIAHFYTFELLIMKVSCQMSSLFSLIRTGKYLYVEIKQLRRNLISAGGVL